MQYENGSKYAIFTCYILTTVGLIGTKIVFFAVCVNKVIEIPVLRRIEN